MIQKIGIKKCNSDDLRFFKSDYTNEKVCLNKKMQEIDHIVSFIVDPIVQCKRVLDTIKSKSIEGTNLEGKYIELEILFKEKILYAPKDDIENLKYLEISYHENCIIAMPDKIEGTAIEYLLGINRLTVEIYVEDVSIQFFDRRNLLINLYYMAEVKYIPTYEIVYISNSPNDISKLMLCYCDGSNSVEKLNIRKYKCINPKWSPNGLEIGFLSNEYGDFFLYILNSKTGRIQCLTEYYEFERVLDYSWKDHNTIIFTAFKEGVSEIFSINIVSKEVKQLTISTLNISNFNGKYSKEKDSILFIRESHKGRHLWQMKLSGDNQRMLTYFENVQDFCYSYDSKYIIAICRHYAEQDSISIIDTEFNDEIEVLLPDKYFSINNLCSSFINHMIAFVATSIEENREDIFLYFIKKRKLVKLTNYADCVNISSLVFKIDKNIIYFASNEMGNYNIFSVDVINNTKKHICAMNSSYIELDYRPSNH